MITLKSHGHKFGVPEANYKFDVSFFKNPWRDEGIRAEKDSVVRKKKIIKYMEDQEGSHEFLKRIASFVRFINVMWPDENIVVALCCSAGEYRSPAMVEMLAKELEGIKPIIRHNEYSKI